MGRPEPGEQKFPPLLDDYVVALVMPDSELETPGQPESEHREARVHEMAVHPDPDATPVAVEVEFHSMLLTVANHELEPFLHYTSKSTSFQGINFW
ncbi:hypothetical protein ACFY4C_37295 [Actinomadura viridis]|uniref:hypothetical protein n=1 Tax=Actinomadura viridis TaxID=58110 RepID=UPI00369CD978